MKTQEQQFNSAVMRRIYTIYFFKKLGRPMVREIIVLMSLLVVATFFVSIKHVIANVLALNNPAYVSGFFVSAFANTQVTVKILCVAAIGAVLLFIFSVLKEAKGRFLAH